MRTLLLCAVLAIGITSASELRPDSSKRYLFIAPLSDAQKNQIDEGFKAATFIADKLDAKNIAGIAGQLIGKVSSYLGAIGPFVGLALSLFGGPSAELTAIKQLYTRMEGRFDHIDNQFSALRKQVAFVATQVHFTDIESNINAVHTALISLSRTTDLTKYKYEARAFKRTYDNTYESAGIKLYQGITTGGALTGGLFQEYMTFSSYDRGLTANFMGGTLNLLMRAAALEMTYAEITNDPSAARKKQDWVTRFGEVKDKMLAIDRAIVQQYHTQMTTDVNTFATDNPKSDMSNRDFANKLNTMITRKYDWRDWFILVADPYNHDKLNVHACEYNSANKGGRYIALASVEKTHRAMSRSAAMHALTGLSLYRSFVGHGDHQRHYLCNSASTAYNAIASSVRNSCSTYTAAGVWCTKNTDIQVRAPSNRVYSVTPHGTNTAYLFG